MSENLGPHASTKGESTSKTTSKTSYDRLDINKLYKQGKTNEPVTKVVTQKHGMQTLGKAPPARRAGASAILKPEVTASETTNNSSVPQPENQKWTPPPGAPNVPPPGPPPSLQHAEKGWTGPDAPGNYQSQRFAQEFPSLAAGSDLPPRGSSVNSAPPGPQNSSKQDNQYGPGPILRPQTDGNWTQGGGRNSGRPQGPYPSGPGAKDGPERPNLGGPTPQPMSLGQGGQVPPPLGAYPMRGMPPFMNPNGPGGFYPGHGMPRYGVAVPPGAPPSREHDNHPRERGRGPPPSMRPAQQFAVKPILKEEDLKRMDDIDQEGSWASVKDEVDYNKKINFSDDEDESKRERKFSDRPDDDLRPASRDPKKPIRILERQHSTNDRDKYDGGLKSDQERMRPEFEEDWSNNKNRSQYDAKNRGQTGRSRDPRDDDWRGGRFDEESRNKKVTGPPGRDVRAAGNDFSSKHSNLPPRLLRQQQNQQGNQGYSSGQRRTPSPSAGGTDREHHRERERDQEKRPTQQYRILERNRGDSESSNNSIREKTGNNDAGNRSSEKDVLRSSSDKDLESLKNKMEGLNVRNDAGSSENSSSSVGRTPKFSTSSWAEQVDDDDLFEDNKKSSVPLPKPEHTKEERSVPKRVYIQQRKVENMATSKTESQTESHKQMSSQSSSKKEKPSDRGRPVVWGDREEREKLSDVQGDRQSNREIILSEKAKQLPHNQDRHHRRGYEKDTKESGERSDGEHIKEKDSRQHESDQRQDHKNWGSSRPRPSRWGSNDYERTPDREIGARTEGRVDSDKEEKQRGAESSKSKDKELKESKEDFNKHKESSYDKRGSEEESDYRGGKGARSRDKEKGGHNVYQARGGWSRQEGRGKPRGGGSYDRPRRNDFDKDHRDDRSVPSQDEHDFEHRHEGFSEKEQESKKEAVDDRFKKDGGAGDASKKGMKSPVTNKRNARGGARLHGYGPPSDKPFSSGNFKDDEAGKEKPNEQQQQPPKSNTPASGPVPLMELGDISPPNIVAGRPRHPQGGRGRGGNPQSRQDNFQPRGNKRGGGRGSDAKPLMSLSSNEMDKHESEEQGESHDEDSKRNQQRRKDNKGQEKPNNKQNQNEQRSSGPKEKGDGSTGNQDSTNNNRFEPGANGSELEMADSDGQFKRGSSKEKLNFANSSSSVKNANVRNNEKQNQAIKTDNRRGNNKHSAFDTHQQRTAVPPRFQKGSGPGQFSNPKSGDSQGRSDLSDAPNAWDKSITVGKPDPSSSQQIKSQSLQMETKEPVASKNPVTLPSSGSAQTSSVVMDGSSGPLKTMIFENTNFKSVSKPGDAGKNNDLKDGTNVSVTSTGVEFTKDIGLCFGQESGSSSNADIAFVSNFDDKPQSTQPVTTYTNSSKPTPIGQSRNFQSHQPSPVSPLAKDLTEKIQSVRQVWEKPSMPSVAEQSVMNSSEDTSHFHSGFPVSDSFKNDAPRDFNSSLQQSQSGYSSVGSPALAVSKPDSSSSPNSTIIRPNKPQQQPNTIENHVGMSSSPFTYSMQQAPPFGPSAIPSPPTALVYGGSQPLPSHTGVYQAFPHVDSSQVMNSGGRSQFGQYSNPQAAGGPYHSLATSMFMTSMDNSAYGLSSYQQHSHHSQQSGQGPAPNNRSPGPNNMPTSVSNTGGVMSGMKSQTAPGHPSMPHQVIGNQNNYSQMSHHHGGTIPHHQIPPVGHVPGKPTTGYAQSGMSSQSQQIYLQYDPNPNVLNYGGQTYMSSGIRSGGPGGPPPPATPPIQGLQASSSYYSGNAANQVFPGSNQGSGLQQLHVAVAPNPQLQNLQAATQQYGQQQFQMTGYNQLQGYSQQAASTVSALNLGGQLIRPGHNPNTHSHSHFGIKQGMDMVQQSHNSMMKSHDSMMNPTWNAQGFPLNQGFPKPVGSTPSDNRNMGGPSAIGNQRKGSHGMSGMPNMGNSGLKYMPVSSGYNPPPQQQQQKGGRFAGPGPIQRPISTSPAAPVGSHRVGGMKTSSSDHMTKHIHSSMEEGLLDKLMTEGQHRSNITSGAPTSDSSNVMRLMDDRISEKNGGENCSVSLSGSNLTVTPPNQSPLTSNDK